MWHSNQAILLFHIKQQIGRIHAAAFTDEVLYNEVSSTVLPWVDLSRHYCRHCLFCLKVLSKAYFWVQPNFYGVDVTPLYEAAVDSYFAQVRFMSLFAIVLVNFV